MEYNQPSQIVKDLMFGNEAKDKVIKGVEKLNNAVKHIQSISSRTELSRLTIQISDH